MKTYFKALFIAFGILLVFYIGICLDRQNLARCNATLRAKNVELTLRNESLDFQIKARKELIQNLQNSIIELHKLKRQYELANRTIHKGGD